MLRSVPARVWVRSDTHELFRETHGVVARALHRGARQEEQRRSLRAVGRDDGVVHRVAGRRRRRRGAEGAEGVGLVLGGDRGDDVVVVRVGDGASRGDARLAGCAPGRLHRLNLGVPAAVFCDVAFVRVELGEVTVVFLDRPVDDAELVPRRAAAPRASLARSSIGDARGRLAWRGGPGRGRVAALAHRVRGRSGGFAKRHGDS